MENLAWIRDVPPDLAQREVFARRLRLRAAADPAHREGLNAACMEAELAELPRIRAFPTIFRACADARSSRVVDRALEGLGALHPADDNSEGRRLLSQLRESLHVVRDETAGRAIREVVDAFVKVLTPESAPSLGALAAHLAAALDRDGARSAALEVMSTAEDRLDRAPSRHRESGAALAFVRGSLSGGPKGSGALAPQPDQLNLPPPLRPTAAELAYGAIEAARALRDPGPIMHVLGVFDADDVGGVLPESGVASLATELVRGAAYLGGREARLEHLVALEERVRRLRLAPAGDLYLRALVADAAARYSALRSSGEAWDLALRVSARGPGRFERAKMRGRMACEFIAAAQTVPDRTGWLDPCFATVPVAKPPAASLADL